MFRPQKLITGDHNCNNFNRKKTTVFLYILMKILLFYFYLQRKSSFASVEWVISLVYWKLCHLQFRQEHTRGTFSVESFRCLLLWPCNLLNVNKTDRKTFVMRAFWSVCELCHAARFDLWVRTHTRILSIGGLCHACLLVCLWVVSRASFGQSVGCVTLAFWSVCGLCHARLLVSLWAVSRAPFGLSVGCVKRAFLVCLWVVQRAFRSVCRGLWKCSSKRLGSLLLDLCV